MSTFYASYPFNASGVPIYANLAAFPTGVTVGQLGVAADTGNLYEWNGSTWVLIAGPSGTLSVGALDSQTANAQGAAIVADVLSMQSATATFPGLVNNTTQTFSGNKVFNGTVQTGTSTGVNSTNEQLSVLETLTSPQATTATAIAGKVLLSGNTANGTTQRGILGLVERDITVSVTDTGILNAIQAQVQSNIAAAQTYTNSSANGLSAVLVNSLLNSGSGAIAANYRGIHVPADSTAVTGYKTAAKLVAPSGGTNNAAIADNDAFSGNYYVNSSSTNPSAFIGSVRTGTASSLSGNLEQLTVQQTTTTDVITWAASVGNNLNTNTSLTTGHRGVSSSITRTITSSVSDSGNYAAGVFRMQYNAAAAQTVTCTGTIGFSAVTIDPLNKLGSGALASIYSGITFNTENETVTGSKQFIKFFTISGGTNNAFIADNGAYSGNWFINSTSAYSTLISGATTINNSLTLGTNASVAGTVTLSNSAGGGAAATVQNLGTTIPWNFNLPTTAGTSGQVLTSAGGASSSMTWTTPVTGTVTSVSVVSANGFAGTVATATTTPAITLSTSITGILQGNGTAISAATTTGTGSVVQATSPTIATLTVTGTTTFPASTTIDGSGNAIFGGSIQTGTSTGVNSTNERVSILNSQTSPMGTNTSGLAVKTLLTGNTANGVTTRGFLALIERDITASVTDTGILNAMQTQVLFNIAAAQTYTNTSVNNVNGFLINSISNSGAGALAINYHALKIPADSTAVTGYKTSIFVGAQSAGTNNAQIADSDAYSGNYGINLASTNQNYLAGSLGIGSAASTPGRVLELDSGATSTPAVKLTSSHGTAANGAVASVFTPVSGPTGAATSIQGWILIDVGGTTHYMPYW